MLSLSIWRLEKHCNSLSYMFLMCIQDLITLIILVSAFSIHWEIGMVGKKVSNAVYSWADLVLQ